MVHKAHTVLSCDQVARQQATEIACRTGNENHGLRRHVSESEGVLTPMSAVQLSTSKRKYYSRAVAKDFLSGSGWVGTPFGVTQE